MKSLKKIIKYPLFIGKALLYIFGSLFYIYLMYTYTLISSIAIVVIFYILAFYIENNIKKIKNNEEKIEKLQKDIISIEVDHDYPVSTQRFTLDATQAVLSNKMFGELSGIKSAIEGKPYEKWTSAEKQKWTNKYHDVIAKKTRLAITYLSSEDTYFINNAENGLNIITPRNGARYLYSTSLFEDKTEMEEKDNLEFGVIERIRDNLKRERQRVLTVYLVEKRGMFGRSAEPKDVLMELPLDKNKTGEDDLKTLGIEVHRSEGDVYQDQFGEWDKGIDFVECKKNNVTISFMY